MSFIQSMILGCVAFSILACKSTTHSSVKSEEVSARCELRTSAEECGSGFTCGWNYDENVCGPGKNRRGYVEGEPNKRGPLSEPPLSGFARASFTFIDNEMSLCVIQDDRSISVNVYAKIPARYKDAPQVRPGTVFTKVNIADSEEGIFVIRNGRLYAESGSLSLFLGLLDKNSCVVHGWGSGKASISASFIYGTYGQNYSVPLQTASNGAFSLLEAKLTAK